MPSERRKKWSANDHGRRRLASQTIADAILPRWLTFGRIVNYPPDSVHAPAEATSTV